jgi:hypothetical protein
MSSLLEGAAPVWPDAVREYVEYKQETAYRLLGDMTGKDGDPEAVREMLIGKRVPSVKQTPEQVRDELKLAGKFSPEAWEKVKHQIKQVEAAPRTIPTPTRYEDPKTYKLMNEFRLIIMERAAKVGRPIDFPPFLASLPSGDVNARISVIPESEQPVLFFEQGLIQFLLDFAALASWVVPVLPPEDLSDKTLATIPPHHTMRFEGSTYFASSLRSYVVDGNPAVGSVLVPPRPENAFLYEVLFMRMMMFVFIHEFQHLRLGHLARKDTSKESLWKCEYEADIAAATFITDIMGGWALSFWACDLVLIAFNFLDRALAVFEFGDNKISWISQTHPESISRRKALFDSVGAGVSRGSRAAGGNLFAMDQALFQRIWLIIAPGFVSAHLSGVRPSPMWSEKMARSMKLAI